MNGRCAPQCPFSCTKRACVAAAAGILSTAAAAPAVTGVPDTATVSSGVLANSQNGTSLTHAQSPHHTSGPLSHVSRVTPNQSGVFSWSTFWPVVSCLVVLFLIFLCCLERCGCPCGVCRKEEDQNGDGPAADTIPLCKQENRDDEWEKDWESTDGDCGQDALVVELEQQEGGGFSNDDDPPIWWHKGGEGSSSRMS